MDENPELKIPPQMRFLILRKQIEAACIARCCTDPEFRARLLANPQETLERELGVKLPGPPAVQVAEEEFSTWTITIPPPARLSDDVSDDALNAVAGGLNTGHGSVGTIYADLSSKENLYYLTQADVPWQA